MYRTDDEQFGVKRVDRVERCAEDGCDAIVPRNQRHCDEHAIYFTMG